MSKPKPVWLSGTKQHLSNCASPADKLNKQVELLEKRFFIPCKHEITGYNVFSKTYFKTVVSYFIKWGKNTEAEVQSTGKDENRNIGKVTSKPFCACGNFFILNQERFINIYSCAHYFSAGGRVKIVGNTKHRRPQIKREQGRWMRAWKKQGARSLQIHNSVWTSVSEPRFGSYLSVVSCSMSNMPVNLLDGLNSTGH